MAGEIRAKQEKMLGIGWPSSGGSAQQSFNLMEGLQVTLYIDTNFRGPSLTVKYAVSDLGRFNGQFNNRVSSVRVGNAGTWTFYQEPRWQGRSIDLTAGDYPDLGVFGLNDLVSSIDYALPEPPPPPTHMIVLYDEKDFGGSCVSLTFEVPDLTLPMFLEGRGSDPFQFGSLNNRASSALVEGQGSWMLYKRAGYQGEWVELPPGYHRDLAVYGLDNAVSSLKPVPLPPPPPSGKIVLWTGKDLSGSVVVLRHEEANLAYVTIGGTISVINDFISSVEIEEGTWTLYQDADYKGKSVKLSPGRYPDLGAYGLDRSVSSLRIERDS